MLFDEKGLRSNENELVDEKEKNIGWTMWSRKIQGKIRSIFKTHYA